jgi:PAS domain S-box-containing protein
LPVEVRVFLLRDEHGLAVGTWAVARDITRRKIAQRALAEARDTLESRVAERTAELERANAALRASEERYRSLVDNLDVGVFRRSLTGPSTDRLHGNPALARMFGHGSLAEMARRPRAAFFRSAAEYREFSSNLLRRGALHDYQVRLRRRDHSLFWGSITAAVHRDFRGRADWIDAIVEDISDRRRAEAFLEIQRDLGVRLSLAGEMDAALKHLLEVVTGIEGVGSAAVYLAGEVGPGLELAASRGTTGRPAALPAAVLVRGACGRALQHGQPVFGACEGLEFSDGARPRRTPPRFAALLPLRHEEQLIGVLLVGAGTGGAVPESTRMTLEMVSTQASGAMARIQAEAGRRSRASAARAGDSRRPVPAVGRAGDGCQSAGERGGTRRERRPADSPADGGPIGSRHQRVAPGGAGSFPDPAPTGWAAARP